EEVSWRRATRRRGEERRGEGRGGETATGRRRDRGRLEVDTGTRGRLSLHRASLLPASLLSASPVRPFALEPKGELKIDAAVVRDGCCAEAASAAPKVDPARRQLCRQAEQRRTEVSHRCRRVSVVENV